MTVRAVVPLLLALAVVCACGTPARRVRALPGAEDSTGWDRREFDQDTGKPVPAAATTAPGSTKAAEPSGPLPLRPPEPIDGDPWGELAELSDERYVGPRVDAEILSRPGGDDLYTASVNVTVPTGGYRLSFGGARVEGPVMTLLCKLEAPGKDEIRTMSLERLTLRHGAGTQRIRELRVYVNTLTRGERATGYRLAKSIP